MRKAGSPTSMPRAEYARRRHLMAKSKYQQAHDLLATIAEHAKHGLKFSSQEKRVPFNEIMRIQNAVAQLDELISIKADAPERKRRPRKVSTDGAAEATGL